MRSKLILGAVLAVLLAATSASLAFAGGSRHESDDKVRTFHVTLQHRGQDADLDLGASGPSIGDRFIFSGNLVRNGKRVGVGAGDCVLVLFRPGPDPQGEPEAATDQCVATLSLPKGQITAQGLVDRTGPLPIRLAGGRPQVGLEDVEKLLTSKPSISQPPGVLPALWKRDVRRLGMLREL